MTRGLPFNLVPLGAPKVRVGSEMLPRFANPQNGVFDEAVTMLQSLVSFAMAGLVSWGIGAKQRKKREVPVGEEVEVMRAIADIQPVVDRVEQQKWWWM